MTKSALLIAFALTGSCFGQGWLPGWGDPAIGYAPWAMTTWDPDGPGPLGECITIGGPAQDPSASSSQISYWNGRGWQGLRTLTGSIFGLGVHEGKLFAAGNGPWGFSPQISGPVAYFDGARWWSANAPMGIFVDSFINDNGQFFSSGQGTRLWTGSGWIQQSTLAGGLYALAKFNGELVGGTGIGLYRLSPQGWVAWPVPVPGSGSIEGVATYNGQLYCTRGAVGVYRWTGTAWELVPNGPVGPLGDLTVFNGELWTVGSSSTTLGGALSPVARYDGTQWRMAGPGLNNLVYAACQWRGRTVVGGSFSRGSYQTLAGVAYMDGEEFSPLGDGVGPSTGSRTWNVLAMCEFQNDLYVGGEFTTAGGQPASRIARWDGAQWHNVGEGLGGTVTDMVVHEGRLIVAGTFGAAGQVSPTVTAWDGTQWAPMGDGITGTFTCSQCTITPTLRSSNGRLLMAVPLRNAQLATAHAVFEWNGTSWVQLGGEFNGPVNGIAFWNGSLFAGGGFTTVGTTSIATIARWTGTAWVQATTTPSSLGINSLSERNGEMLATYASTSSTARRVVRWDGTGWTPFTYGVKASSSGAAYKAIPVGPDVLVVGSFHHVFTDGLPNGGSTPTSYVAVWRDRLICSSDFNHDGDFGTDADIEAFFACLAGNCCPGCGEADFNGDGDTGTDADIEAFFRVLGGGAC